MKRLSAAMFAVLLSFGIANADSVMPGYQHLTENLATRLDSAMAISYEDPDIVTSVLSSIAENEDCETYREAVRYVINTMPEHEERILSALGADAGDAMEDESDYDVTVIEDESGDIPLAQTDDEDTIPYIGGINLISHPVINDESDNGLGGGAGNDPSLENPFQVSGN